MTNFQVSLNLDMFTNTEIASNQTHRILTTKDGNNLYVTKKDKIAGIKLNTSYDDHEHATELPRQL